jgi:cell wall-associated NlpC family hydrolase
MTDKRVVRIPTTVWTDPARVRDIDAAAVADESDLAGWAAGLDTEGRLDLHGRTVTQALPGEPVLVDSERDGWAAVVLPWQPSSLDLRGYPGWVRAAHLGTGDAGELSAAVLLPDGASVEGDGGAALVATARSFLGLDYLWAGFTGYGVDCSGLVSLTYRSHGVLIPRDAHDQAVAGEPVELDALCGGDLVFFGENDGRGPIHHVGMAVGDGTMLHSPRTGRQVEICPLNMPGYAEELCAARRYI